MSHVVNYDGQYFRVEITEIANPDDPNKVAYVGWCSDAFQELKDMPSKAPSRFIAGPPIANYAEVLRHAYSWIKTDWDSRQAKRVFKASTRGGVLYMVWIFKGDNSYEFEFEEFADARAFARAAEKSFEVTKVGIKNNESPQYLTVWDRPTEG